MKKILLLLVFTIFAAEVNAQQPNKDQIDLLKTSFITKELNLTSSEAEAFWPVYNLYNKEIHELRGSLEFGRPKRGREESKPEDVSEEEARKLIKNSIEIEKKIVENKVKMIEELLKVLPAKKIIKLHRAERDFNRRILQEYRKRKGGPGGSGR